MQNDNEGPRTAEGQAGGRNTEREGKKKKKGPAERDPQCQLSEGGLLPTSDLP